MDWLENFTGNLPAAWFTPGGRWYVVLSLLILMGVSFVIGYAIGKKSN